MNLLVKIKKLFLKLSHPIMGEIWCLHRVLPLRSIFDSNRDLQITPTYLQSIVESYLRDGYKFVSLDSFVSAQGLIRRYCRKKWCVITFDDGFRDIYEYAYPILKKYSIPFTIYLTTGMPDGTACLWWEQLESYVNSSQEFEFAMQSIVWDSQNMSDAFCRLYQCKPDFELTQRLSLSWSQLHEMVDSGLCTIGSHTVSHPGLTKLSLENVRNELIQSKSRIEKMLDVPVRHFSYPHSMMNAQIAQMMESCGYKTAVMGYGGGYFYRDNPYKLNRKYIVEK